MKHIAASASALALLLAPAFAADMPLNPQPLPPIAEEATDDMSELNPQPLPPVAEAMEASSDLNPQPLPPIEAAEAQAAMMAEVDARVRITNGTGAAIAELFSSRAGGGNWQPILAGGTVPPGASVTVNFENAARLCEFDLRAIFTDGSDQVVQNLDACTVGELTFTG